MAALVREHEVGRRASVDTPFGRRLLCYADLTASGRYLHFVEAWIRRARPFYANSHTSVSSTGRIMTSLRERARDVIRRAVHASPDDLVIFTGSGATSAVNKLVGLLGLRVSELYEERLGLRPDERPVVLLGPYEHHSNELPWVESVAEVVEVGLDAEGGIDLADLEAKLRHYAARPLVVGSFSAASNVTGVLSDVHAVARLLHRHGALACFDFAAAGPYVPIDMHPDDDDARLDAIFVSPHKFMGGPQASGLLVAHRSLVRTRAPERPGGGTVDYVAGPTRQDVDYVGRLDEREEAGTPSIVGDLRAGVAFLVKELLGPDEVRAHEVTLAREALARLGAHPKIRLLGPTGPERLAIVSFNVEGLHHDFVAVLLDHLFGIQNRAGCSCAGPYGHRLLGIERDESERYRALVRQGINGIKPGWVRLTLPYYASREDIDFVLSAVELVATFGARFLPLYSFDWSTGAWAHLARPVPDVEPLELTALSLLEAARSFAPGDHEAPMGEAQIASERARYLREAQALGESLPEPSGAPPRSGVPELDRLTWFRVVHALPLRDEPGRL